MPVKDRGHLRKSASLYLLGNEERPTMSKLDSCTPVLVGSAAVEQHLEGYRQLNWLYLVESANEYLQTSQIPPRYH